MQPMYLPWKGIFDLIQNVDVFVFFDDVQFTPKSTKSRNIIKGPNGPIQLVVPTHAPESRPKISDVTIAGLHWRQKHERSIQGAYRKAPYFVLLQKFLRDTYRTHEWQRLVDLNVSTTKALADILSIRAPEWCQSSDIPVEDVGRTQRVVEIARYFGATTLVNGPSARKHLDAAVLREAKLKSLYLRYEYPEYKQLFPPFVHEVSIIDTIAALGPHSRLHLDGGLEE